MFFKTLYQCQISMFVYSWSNIGPTFLPTNITVQIRMGQNDRMLENRRSYRANRPIANPFAEQTIYIIVDGETKSV